jgi:hypothetical protein
VLEFVPLRPEIRDLSIELTRSRTSHRAGYKPSRGFYCYCDAGSAYRLLVGLSALRVMSASLSLTVATTVTY